MSAAAFAATADWGTAIEVPGTAGLNLSNARVTSISCASPGNCAAGGYYGQGNSGRAHVFVVNEMNGVWGSAVEVPRRGHAYLNAISCATAHSCAAVGSYTDRSGHTQAFVVDERHGVWREPIKVPGTARLNRGGLAVPYTISCPKPGFCATGGTYDDGSAGAQAFVANEVRGVWRKAIEVPGSAALNLGAFAQVRSISCATARSCAAGGMYFGLGGPSAQPFVVNEKNGVWEKAIKVPPPFKHAEMAWVNSISCGAAGSCAAGGVYDAGANGNEAFVVNEKHGVWRKAIQVPGVAALDGGGPGNDTEVYSLSCAKAGSCVAGGSYTGGSSFQPFVVSETNGIWRRALEVPGLTALDLGGDAEVTSVSCGAAGSCAAGGHYTDGSKGRQAFVVSETDGVWSDAVEVPGLAAINVGSAAKVAGISCAAAGSCTVGGSYTDGSGFEQAFVTAP